MEAVVESAGTVKLMQAVVKRHADSDNAQLSQSESAERKQLLRSDFRVDAVELSQSVPTDARHMPDLEVLDGGVPLGTCKNFLMEGEQEATVTCPKPLKMVGCSCRDKEGEDTGACGTQFKDGEQCRAMTKLGKHITAYARCCHMDWATNFSIQTGIKSQAGDGQGSQVTCPIGTTVLGCGCVPGDAPNNGCKHTLVYDQSCTATNLEGHAGVKAQALCAYLPNSSSWEAVELGEHVVKKSTNLSCSKPYPELQMISCSCGSSTGKCNGGKVLANRCECYGERCYATARCAKVPIPAMDCIWNQWGEWTDCSTSCGKGKQTRLRQIAMLPMNGGKNCTGATNMTVTCNGEAKESECMFVMKPPIAEKGSSYFSVTTYVGFILVLAGAAGALYNHHLKQQKHIDDFEDDGEEYHQQGGGGDDFWGGNEQQDCTEDAWDHDAAEDDGTITGHVDYNANDGW